MVTLTFRQRVMPLVPSHRDYHGMPVQQSWSSEWSPIYSHECRHKHQAYNRKASQSCSVKGKGTNPSITSKAPNRW